MKEHVITVIETISSNTGLVILVSTLLGLYFISIASKIPSRKLKLINTSLILMVGAAMFGLSSVEVDDSRYSEIKDSICVSKNHSTKEKIKKFYNEKDGKITVAEALNIQMELEKCQSELWAEKYGRKTTKDAAKAKEELLNL